MSRGGGKGSKFTTGNITQHMETWHPDVYGPLKAAADEKKAIEKASKGHNIQTFFSILGVIQQVKPPVKVRALVVAV